MASSQRVLYSTFLLLFAALSFYLAVEAVSDYKQLYIVYLGERQHEDPNLVTASHHDMLSSLLGSKEEAVRSMVYSYRHSFSGFAAFLTDSHAQQIADLPEVISIKLSGSVPLQTTRSWDYLGLGFEHQQQPSGLLERAKYGEDVIIGVVDTGIWPESRSFDDTGYGPIPSRWKGKCEVGQNFTVDNCNRKIIGARWYTGGIKKSELRKVDLLSPRDIDGHGTHTASTAAGSLVASASFHGLGVGTARGGAPRARLAIYKACWKNQGCPDATVLKAIDDAVGDGVDILSLSLGGALQPNFASIHAVAKGITVIFAAGNDGPIPQTMSNDLPWVITVAASTVDRSFPTVLTLGDNQTVVGQSLYYAAKDKGFKDLVIILHCTAEVINSTDVAGKIVACGDSLYAFDTMASSARQAVTDLGKVVSSLVQADAKGVISTGTSLGILLASLLTQKKGFVHVVVDDDVLWQILNYFASASDSTSPTVKVSPASTIVGSRVMAPTVAAFSSRGPSILYPDLIKPDITAPGVSILAAKRDSYAFDSGTSMACPHVSGVVALLKAVHPHWSPAAIKSALVTTAHTMDAYGFPIEADGLPRKLADPFDFGGGHIDPNKAVDPGLIYDVDPKDYLKFFQCTNDASDCDLVDSHLYQLNLPSIAISDLNTPVTVWRTVTNVGDANSIYKVVVEAPSGVNITVQPSVLEFNASMKMQTFALTFTPVRMVQCDFRFGSLTWHDGGNKHSVRIPIAVRVIIQPFFSYIS
ncbi:subtilisin-like protease SBT3.5 [Canna indica]|uniref:Subtilisin-like protease SBT3.5 n=1 Tax=Canna indica TaxID=4628 RepID=A0AAQ3Q2C9_9LILI|nr:subtilisin-like protease SBT3.5 [Canna indica]